MGLCPRCLLSRVVEVRRNVQKQMDRLSPPRYEPLLAELAVAFPKLRIERLIARGGMGVVYKAFDRDRNQPVALKVLPIDKHGDVDMLGRFIAESRILASLDHPNIVAAYESGQTSGYLYLVMEWINGPSLRQILSRGPLPPNAAVAVATQICDALVYAHERDIIHRDIKPENILLHPGSHAAEPGLTEFFEQGGRARLVDFGLARPLRETVEGMSPTAPHHYVGTADYIAPESRYGTEPPDARADVYSLGVVLYEMLTGRLPLGHFPPPGGSRRLARIVLRCLANDPSRRYADAADLRRALANANSRRAAIFSAGAIVGVIALAILWIFRPPRPIQSAPASPSVAISIIAASPTTTMPVAASQPSTTRPSPTSLPVTLSPTIAMHVAPEPATAPTHPTSAAQFPNSPPLWAGHMRPDFPFPPWRNRPSPQTMIDRFGFDHVIEVFVDGVTSGEESAIAAQLRHDSGALAVQRQSTGNQLTIYLAPCSDIGALAAKINFAKVAGIDTQKRVIRIEMPPAPN
jgi:serine/threonine protein kinase